MCINVHLGQVLRNNKCMKFCASSENKRRFNCIPRKMNCPSGEIRKGNVCVPKQELCPPGQIRKGNICVPIHN